MRHIRHIVVINIADIGGTAESVGTESGNIRCTAGIGLKAGRACAVADTRTDRGGYRAAGLDEYRAVVLLGLDIVAGIGEGIQVDIIQHIRRDSRSGRRKGTDGQSGHQHYGSQKHGQPFFEAKLFLCHDGSFLS